MLKPPFGLHGEKTLCIPTSGEKQLLVPEMVKKKIRACIKTRTPRLKTNDAHTAHARANNAISPQSRLGAKQPTKGKCIFLLPY